MALNPEEFIDKVEGVMRLYDVTLEEDTLPNYDKKLSGIKGYIPSVEYTKNFRFNSKINAAADRITLGIETLLTGQKDSDAEKQSSEEGLYGVIIYSGLEPHNKYAILQFDLKKEILIKVTLSENGRKMMPDVKNIRNKKLDEAVEEFFATVFFNRYIPKKQKLHSS